MATKSKKDMIPIWAAFVSGFFTLAAIALDKIDLNRLLAGTQQQPVMKSAPKPFDIGSVWGSVVDFATHYRLAIIIGCGIFITSVVFIVIRKVRERKPKK